MARRRSRARPVRTERITVKRYCDDGSFAPRAARDNHCGAPKKAGPRADAFSPRPSDRDDQVCYGSRGEAMRAFVSRNRALIEAVGGLDVRLEGGELDSINEKYGLRGRRRARTVRQAIQVAMGQGKCLDTFDLAALNDTPICSGECALPDAVAEAAAEESYREGAEQAAERAQAAEEAPFDLFGLRERARQLGILGRPRR